MGDFGIAVADRLPYKGDDAITFKNSNDDNDHMQVFEGDDGDKDEDSREFARKCAGHAMDKILLNEGPGATLEPPQEISPYWRVLV